MSDVHTSDISVELKVTDRCNQGCFYCMNNDPPYRGRDLDSALFTSRLVEWHKNRGRYPWRIRELRMTGGEPLINLDSVLKIARVCKHLNIHSGINTTGLLLGETTAQALKDVNLKTVKLSFDAVDQATLWRIRGKNASMSKMIKSVHIAVAYGFSVLLRFTLCRYNVDQLLDCYRLARKLGAEKFQVKPMICSGRAAASDAFLSREEICQAFRGLAAATKGTATRLEVLCWPPEDVFGLPSKVCGSMNKIYVATNGDTFICNYVPEPIRFGNLVQEPIERVLSNHIHSLWRSTTGYTLAAHCPQTSYFNTIRT